MVMKKIDKNQAKLGIKTYDYNVPKDHISRFVVKFIESFEENNCFNQSDFVSYRKSFL